MSILEEKKKKNLTETEALGVTQIHKLVEFYLVGSFRLKLEEKSELKKM